MKYPVAIFFLLIMLCLSFTIVTQADAVNDIRTLSHDGVERHYRLFVPDSGADTLLIVLHPYASSAYAMQIITDFNDAAAQYGFAVAYPDADGYYWDDGRIEAGLPPYEEPIDDAGFVLALVDNLRASLNVENVYLTGLENGAGMAYRMACTAPEQFEAIIPVNFMMWEYHTTDCNPSAAVNIFIITGAEHPLFVPGGEQVEYLSTGNVFRWMGWQETVNYWRESNNCGEDSRDVAPGNPTFYTGCDDDTTVTFMAIPGAGANWTRMSDNTLNRFGVDITNVISAYLKGSDWQSLSTPQNATESLARSYVLYVPTTYNAQISAPLVVILHGRLSNANNVAYTSNFNQIAEREGVIVAYPNAINTTWNYLSGIPDVDSPEYDDDAFIEDMITDISRDINIDSDRIYLAGISNGGFMTQRLACTMQNTFAATVSIGATAFYSIETTCENTDPIPHMYIHGTADTIVRWNGNLATNNDGRQIYISYPMPDSINFWIRQNQCSTSVSQERLPVVDPETTTEILTFTECGQDSALIVYIVYGGGHVWHGSRDNLAETLGQNSQDFNSSEVIWSFFSQYSLNQRETQ